MSLLRGSSAGRLAVLAAFAGALVLCAQAPSPAPSQRSQLPPIPNVVELPDLPPEDPPSEMPNSDSPGAARSTPQAPPMAPRVALPPEVETGQKPKTAPGDLTAACPKNVKPRIYTMRDAGETVEGPACIVVRLNGLRYSWELAKTTTDKAGPNLASALMPAEGGGAPPPPDRVAAGEPKTPSLQERLIEARIQWLSLQARNEQAAADIASAVASLKAVVAQSDDLFRSGGSSGVVTSFMMAYAENAQRPFEWQSAGSIQALLRGIDADAARQALSAPDDAGRAKLSAIRSDVAGLRAELAPSMDGGEKAVAFRRQQDMIEFWKRVIDSLNETSFEKATYVACGGNMTLNHQTAIKISTADRLVSFESQPLVLADSKDAIVTVNCPSALAISAGVEVRFLKTSSFGLVPTGPSGATQFGVTDNQNRIPLPVVLAHVRLLESASHRYALFASVGAAAHSQGAGTAGSAAEYLAGASLGLFRTMFVTAGAHFGKVSALGGGYRIGDAVPSGVTTVPVTGSYNVGFGLAFTFTKP